MDHTPHFDGLRREEGGTPPPAHQEGMEFTTGEHLYRPEQQSTQRIAFQTEVSIEGEAGNDSVLSSEGSAWQCNTDYSPLQEVQTHLQVGVVACGLHCRNPATKVTSIMELGAILALAPPTSSDPFVFLIPSL